MEDAEEQTHDYNGSMSEAIGHLASRVTRKDIASYLGITLETLSRLGY